MIIRKAKKNDFKVISDIFRVESAKSPYNQKWSSTVALKKINEFAKHEDIHIACIDGQVIGFVVWRVRISETGRGAFIEELWIKKAFQGQGIGTKIMNFIENYCKKNKIGSLFLISHEKAKAFEFYKRKDFREHRDFILLGKTFK